MSARIAPATDPLLERAARLRAEAEELHPVLAASYRRRAAELSLEAWARTVLYEPADVDSFTALTAVAA